MTAPRRQRFVRPRVLMQRLHLWASLTLGLFLLVVTTSGVVALFELDLHRLSQPQLFHVTSGPDPVGLDEAKRTLHAAYPDYLVTDAVAKPATAYLLYLEGEDETHLNAYVDPGTGRLNGVLEPTATLPGWFAHLHVTLLADKITFTYPEWVPGWVQTLVGATLSDLLLKLVAFALFVMVLTGGYLWWPGMRKLALAFSLRFKRSRYLKHYDLHKVVGFASLPFLFMWAVTAMNFYEPFSPIIKRVWYALTFSQDAVAQDYASTVTGDRMISARRAEDVASRAVPEATFISYSPPREENGVVEVWLAHGVDPYAYSEWPGNVNLKLDAYSGRVLYNSLEHTPSWGAEVYNSWFFNLHSGWAVPWWARTIWALFGLVPLVLAVTGLSMWRLKRNCKVPVTGKVGQADSAGAPLPAQGLRFEDLRETNRGGVKPR